VMPRAERDGGPSARNETGNGDQPAPTRGELPLGPADSLHAPTVSVRKKNMPDIAVPRAGRSGKPR
jgi:hypothetical protein